MQNSESGVLVQRQICKITKQWALSARIGKESKQVQLDSGCIIRVALLESDHFGRLPCLSRSVLILNSFRFLIMDECSLRAKTNMHTTVLSE